MSTAEKLDKIANDSWYNKGVNADTIRYSAKVFSRYLRKGDFLELGPAEGVLTEQILPWVNSLTLVDGSPVFCENLKKKFPAATVVNSLFEDLSLEKTYDFIVLGHVLEHVKDPVEVLKRIRPLLRRSGRLLAAVPNARSIHRQAAVMMGILDTEYTLNDMDIHHGHYRVYNPELFRNDFLKAGYSIEASGGYWLKPLSNKQLEEEWSAEMIEAFMKLGEQYPDIAGEIYMVASSPE